MLNKKLIEEQSMDEIVNDDDEQVKFFTPSFFFLKKYALKINFIKFYYKFFSHCNLIPG